MKIVPVLASLQIDGADDVGRIDAAIRSLELKLAESRARLTLIARDRLAALIEDRDQDAADLDQAAENHHLAIEKIDAAMPILEERQRIAVNVRDREAKESRDAALRASFKKAMAERPEFVPNSHLSKIHAEEKLWSDFQAAFEFISELHPVEVDRSRNVNDWMSDYEAWAYIRRQPSTIWGAAFIYAAMAHGDVKIDFERAPYVYFGLSVHRK